MLHTLPEPNPDPIFRVAKLAKKRGDHAIDATFGVLCGDNGQAYIMKCTRDAVQTCFQEMEDADLLYPDILGFTDFREIATDKMLKGSDVPVASFATAGGQGALKTNIDLAKRMGVQQVIVPEPSWKIYDDLLVGSGINKQSVTYLKDGSPQVEALLHAISSTRAPTLLLLQGSGHNPSGKDFSLDQWGEITDQLKGANMITLLDFAYQGLVETEGRDVEPIQKFIQKNIPLLLAWSASKNHTLYSFRTGLAAAVAENDDQKRTIEGHYSSLSSEMHSVAPIPGQKVVTHIQKHMRNVWSTEVDDARGSVKLKREKLLEQFSVEQLRQSVEGKGLYCLLPLMQDQILELRDKHDVFILDDGRVNISAIPEERIDDFVKAVEDVFIA